MISQAVELAGRTVELNLPVPPPSAPAAPVAAEVKPEPLIDPRQRTREELESLLSTLEIRTTANPDGPVEPPTTQAGIPADAAEENPIEKQKRRWLKLKLREETTETRTGPPRSPTAREDTLAALERMHQAPAMASLARSFVQITRQENVDLGEIVEVVEKDPAIAARVLRMANSAMVAPASRIGDLRTAVTLLGVQRVRLTAQALTTLQESRNLVEGVNWKHRWIHSFACALLSPEIPRRLRIPVPEYAYLAGIVHDLGKILLSSLQPAEYRKLLMEASVNGTPLMELERRQFGVTHEEAGAATSEMKNVEGIWHRSGLIKCPGACSGDVYSRPELATDDATLAAVVNVANFLAKAHGLGFSGSPLGPDEEALEDTKGWRLLQDVVAYPQKADEFHLFLRPFLHDLKQEMHEWVSGRRMGG